MHYHCEIVIPPTMDIEAAVTSVLNPYCEHVEDLDEDDQYTAKRYGFWDFWVIGGRWAGRKLLAKYDKAKVDEFYEWLQAEKITVSDIQFGKQELSPASQVPKVDAKWNEMFPSAEFVPCPVFRHSNDQFGKGLSSTLPSDITRLSDVPAALTCGRVIFAKPSFVSESKDWTGPLEAAFMLTDSAYNGCNHMKVEWDGTFASAVDKYRESLKNYSEEFAARVTPQNDWLVITVDYHS
jgi:hypothetical protein